MKKVEIKSKKSREEAAADFVRGGGLESDTAKPVRAKGERMKRLTIDIPESLHRRIKAYCANHGLIMADQLREILEKRFPKS